MRVVVIGSANVDMIGKVSHLPRAGETVLGGQFHMACGGKGANQAVAAARLEAEAWFVGRVGGDYFGDLLLSSFAECGVRTEHVVRDAEAPSGIALIFVDERGENCIVVAPGANGRVSPGDVERAEAVSRQADVVLLQLEIPLESVARAVEVAGVHNVQVVLNPAPYQPLPREVLERVSVLTPNETEAEGLVGKRVTDLTSAERAALELRAMGVGAVVLTLGENGAIICNGDGVQHVPAFKVKAVDTTAAGDAFCGALAVRLAEGAELMEAVKFACAAGALACTKVGAQPSLPARVEVEQLMKSADD